MLFTCKALWTQKAIDVFIGHHCSCTTKEESPKVIRLWKSWERCKSKNWTHAKHRRTVKDTLVMCQS